MDLVFLFALNMSTGSKARCFLPSSVYTCVLHVVLVCVVIVCADETLSLSVAELGRDALSVQAAPHDPGISLQ